VSERFQRRYGISGGVGWSPAPRSAAMAPTFRRLIPHITARMCRIRSAYTRVCRSDRAAHSTPRSACLLSIGLSEWNACKRNAQAHSTAILGAQRAQARRSLLPASWPPRIATLDASCTLVCLPTLLLIWGGGWGLVGCCVFVERVFFLKRRCFLGWLTGYGS